MLQLKIHYARQLFNYRRFNRYLMGIFRTRTVKLGRVLFNMEVILYMISYKGLKIIWENPSVRERLFTFNAYSSCESVLKVTIESGQVS